MRILEIITFSDYKSGSGGDLFELEDGRNEDEAFCSWWRTEHPECKDWSDKKCMEGSECGWFVKHVGKLPPPMPAASPYEI